MLIYYQYNISTQLGRFFSESTSHLLHMGFSLSEPTEGLFWGRVSYLFFFAMKVTGSQVNSHQQGNTKFSLETLWSPLFSLSKLVAPFPTYTETKAYSEIKHLLFSSCTWTL